MRTEPLLINTPIGKIEAPEWEVKKICDLSDGELINKALEENRKICVSLSTFAMIEKRGLGRLLQQAINPNVGISHTTLDLISKW